MSNYTLIDETNLPEPGDIIATEANLLHPSDDNFEEEFEINFFREVLDYNGEESVTGYPLYTTVDLHSYAGILPRHKLIDSIFNNWYIIVDESEINKRKNKINTILND